MGKELSTKVQTHKIKPTRLTLGVQRALFAGTLSVLATPLALAQDNPTAVDEQSRAGHNDPTEVIVITASPLERNQLNSAQPVSVISADELREKHAHTLGETLSKEPGINSTHFANVAAAPIIRGLDGPRVKITQNGLDTADVSRGSPDHAVTTETSTATQIEVLRGPATLLYGSGAIGGVVNVVDNRIAKQPSYETSGTIGVSGNTAANNREANFSLDSGHAAHDGSVVLHLDGFYRSSDDYDTPDFTNDEGETEDHVENTFIDAQGANLGLSYATDAGYFGVSFGRLEQEYGIPGHAHGHEDEHADEHADEPADEHAHEAEEAAPFADLTQDRWQVLSGWDLGDQWLRQIELKFAYTDYQHSEIEAGIAATTFTNQQREFRVNGRHQAVAGWDGAIGVHYFNTEQTALGDEAYTPDSESTRKALFWLGEQSFGAYNWQIGARYEDVKVTSQNSRYDFSPLSASVGFTRPLNSELQVSANFSYAERAPAANEIFANGNHFATRTYELGLAYELHQEGAHEYHVEATDVALQLEASRNLDLGLHFEDEHFHAQLNLFYNRVDNFIYGDVTGVDNVDLHQEHEHEHAHEDEAAHDHADALPVIAYAQSDVDLYGYELSGGWHITEAWHVNVFSDFTRAHLRDGGNLPRIPAQRIGAELEYRADRWDAKLGNTYYGDQNRVAENESRTAGYNVVDAKFSYYPQSSGFTQFSIYAKAENLTNELGFVHTSFLKADAPIRGRNFSIGVRAEF